MRPPALAAVVFDVDGVLVDSEPFLARCLAATFRHLHHVEIPVSEFLALAGSGSRCITEPAARRNIPVDLANFRTALFHQHYIPNAPAELRPFPGARTLVVACRQAGLKTAVASNGSSIKVAANLRVLGLPPSGWDAVVTAEDVSDPKPNPAIYLAALERLGVLAATAMAVEDSPSGVQAARAAGLRCVAVANTFSQQELVQAGAERVVSTIGQIGLDPLRG